MTEYNARVVVRRKSFKHNRTCSPMQLTGADRYRIGSLWYSVQDRTRWQHGTMVDEVHQFAGRHKFAIGDLVLAENAGMQPVVTFRINNLEMCNLAELTTADFVALGYPDRNSFVADIPLYDTPRFWIMRFDIVERFRSVE